MYDIPCLNLVYDGHDTRLDSEFLIVFGGSVFGVCILITLSIDGGLLLCSLDWVGVLTTFLGITGSCYVYVRELVR